MADVEINLSGPVFDGRAAHEVTAFLDEAKQDVGQQGYSNVMRNLNASIQHPTPYYETQIITERQANDVVVHDRGIIYGPWLEGIGSRNRTTRFKGYFSFRRATQQLRGQATGLAERLLREKYLRRMQ